MIAATSRRRERHPRSYARGTELWRHLATAERRRNLCARGVELTAAVVEANVGEKEVRRMDSETRAQLHNAVEAPAAPKRSYSSDIRMRAVLSRPTTRELPRKKWPSSANALQLGGCFSVQPIPLNRSATTATDMSNVGKTGTSASNLDGQQRPQRTSKDNPTRQRQGCSSHYFYKLARSKSAGECMSTHTERLRVADSMQSWSGTQRLQSQFSQIDRRRSRKHDRRDAIQLREGVGCSGSANGVPKFNSLADSQLHFGTRVAIETRSGKFIMQSQSTRPHKQPYFTCKSLEDKLPSDVFIFRLVDLYNVGSRRPLQWNDHIWLQVGDTGDNILTIVAPKVHQAESLPSVRLGTEAGTFSLSHTRGTSLKSCGGLFAVQIFTARNAKVHMSNNISKTRKLGQWTLRPLPKRARNRFCNQVAGAAVSNEGGDHRPTAVVGSGEHVLLEQDFFNFAADKAGTVLLRPRDIKGISDNASAADSFLRFRMLEDRIETGMSDKQQKHLEVTNRALEELQQSFRLRSGEHVYIPASASWGAPIIGGVAFTRDLRGDISSVVTEMELGALEHRKSKEEMLAELTNFDRPQSVGDELRRIQGQQCTIATGSQTSAGLALEAPLISSQLEPSKLKDRHRMVVARSDAALGAAAMRWPANKTELTAKRDSSPGQASVTSRMKQFEFLDKTIIDDLMHVQSDVVEDDAAPRRNPQPALPLTSTSSGSRRLKQSAEIQRVPRERSSRRGATMHSRREKNAHLVQTLNYGATKALKEFFSAKNLEVDMRTDDAVIAQWLKYQADKVKIKQILEDLNKTINHSEATSRPFLGKLCNPTKENSMGRGSPFCTKSELIGEASEAKRGVLAGSDGDASAPVAQELEHEDNEPSISSIKGTDRICIDLPQALFMFQRDVALLAASAMGFYRTYRQHLEHDLSAALVMLDTRKLLKVCNIIEDASDTIVATGLKDSVNELRNATRAIHSRRKTNKAFLLAQAGKDAKAELLIKLENLHAQMSLLSETALHLGASFEGRDDDPKFHLPAWRKSVL